MKKIEKIDDLKLCIDSQERKFNSKGLQLIDLRVSEKYVSQGYHLFSKKEGSEKFFNSMVSSVTHIQITSRKGKKTVTLNIAPTRYLIGQAMRDCLKEGNYTPEQIQKMSPDMLNVSLIAPVKINGEYFLLSQIKGKTLGQGQIHAGLVSGNVDAKYLKKPEPLITTLQNECVEELGLNLSHMNLPSFGFLVDERETGQINLVFIASHINIDQVFQTYDLLTRKKLIKSEKLEVIGLALLPITSLVETKSGPCVKKITVYTPSKTGLVKRTKDQIVRPYTAIMLNYLSKPANMRFLLNKAGF